MGARARINEERAHRRAEQGWRIHLAGAYGTRPDDLARLLDGFSLPELFRATATRRHDHPAVTIGEQSASHGELDADGASMAGWLVGQGIRRGDRVLLCAGTSLNMVRTYLALLRAGVTVVLVAPGSTRPELAYFVNNSGARAAITDRDSGSGLAELGAQGSLQQVLRVDEVLAAGRLYADCEEPDWPTPDDVALIAYSSGTTGAPKPVPLTHRNLVASIKAAMLAWRWRPDDVLVHALPLSHQHGLGGVHATLIAGSEAIIQRRFDPAVLWRTLEERSGTVLFGVPSIYERLVAWAESSGAVPPESLRLPVCGSAPLSPILAERAESALGHMPLERYGLTESGLDVSNPYDGPRRPGTVGLPLPGVELAIIDRNRTEVPDGRDGEIVLRGPQLFSGYLDRPSAPPEPFLEGGWFQTGDVGRIDPANGYLSITGRIKELIISGGLNVYPREVEAVLEAHPSVAEAAVVGIRSSRWGEEVVAAVVATDATNFDRVRVLQALRERLSPYKCPKQIFIVEALPRNALGKLLRPQVRKLVEEQAGNDT